MITVTFIDFDGAAHTVSAPEDWSLMLAATRNGIDGIEATCGGGCACATCHVIVDPAWIGRLPPPASNEEAMLGNVETGREPGSRLSCQITLTPALNGLTVRLPEYQS